MNNVAIIPARGGSQRIPRKNVRAFHGKPIIAYSIETARASGLFQRIIVSTDDQEIGEIAATCGAEVKIRPPAWALDTVGTQDVIGHVLFMLQYSEDYLPDLACCIYATAPLMTAEDLCRGYNLIAAAPDRTQYAFSVAIRSPLRDAGQFYWGRPMAFVRGRELQDCDSIMVGIPENRVCDINTEDDWLRAERMYADLKMKVAA